MNDSNPPPPPNFVDVDGLNIAFHQVGEGPPVVLLHGWPTSSYLWRKVLPELSKTSQVIAIDLPGFGASDKPLDRRYDFGLFEGAIDGVLGALKADRVAMCGHDLGGPIAVHWAITRPERISQLALLNTLLYPEFSDSVIQFVNELQDPRLREHRTSPTGITEVLRLGVNNPDELNQAVLAQYLAPFVADDARLALAKAGIELPFRGFVEIAEGLSSLRCPVRVIYGADDQLLPDVGETMDRLARDLAGAEVIALPGVGHFVQEDAPALVAEMLASFFAKLPVAISGAP